MLPKFKLSTPFHLAILLSGIHPAMKVKVGQSYPTLRHNGLYSPWNSPGQNTEVGSCSLLQGIFPTQGSNSGLPHCRRILYLLSHQGSPHPTEIQRCLHTEVQCGTVLTEKRERERETAPGAISMEMTT